MPVSRVRALSKEERIARHEKRNAPEKKWRKQGKASVAGTSKVRGRTRDYIGIRYDNGALTLRRRFAKVKGKANVKAHKKARRRQ